MYVRIVLEHALVGLSLRGGIVGAVAVVALELLSTKTIFKFRN